MAESEPSSKPSKNALKNAAKEAEKAKKKAERSALLEQQKLELQQQVEDDFAARNYGEGDNLYPQTAVEKWIPLRNIEEHEDRECVFRMVVAEAPGYVSTPMIKFAVNIPPELICTVVGVVKRTSEKIQSTTIQDFELHARRISTVSKAQLPLPLQPADSEGPLPSEDKDATYEIYTPKIIGAPTKGGSSVFRLDYFYRSAYLAQSPQLAKQMAIQSWFPRVIEIGLVFRAENSNTVRHLTGKETKLIRKVYAVEPFKLPAISNIPRIEFSEGVMMLREVGESVGDYDDLTTPQEKKLGQLILEKYGSDFYTLDQFPTAVRPFYTMPSKKNKNYANSYDMFMRGQEILSGAQRIYIHELLVERIREQGMSPDADGLRDYVEGFRYRCPPNGGGGIGLERIVQFYLGLPNIRMTSLFPRDPNRVLP
ncbi:class II aaRS and biotin synthetase [Westerdykella ornata]|uniref:aspartate--tRNA ligase n=1 Tax=Westerdykella ornata TaxID=318751 RepID=A0A6A6JBC4_WESOR|nr:class II aaRS and biotin synthetase [Westerdykella ornata]KAF2272936.1 class II aaRS and biotin synthetase [Westerdykella ornata]